MTQLTFGDAELGSKRKITRKERLLSKMQQLVASSALQRLVASVNPEAGDGRRAYVVRQRNLRMERHPDSRTLRCSA